MQRSFSMFGTMLSSRMKVESRYITEATGASRESGGSGPHVLRGSAGPGCASAGNSSASCRTARTHIWPENYSGHYPGRCCQSAALHLVFPDGCGVGPVDDHAELIVATGFAEQAV